MNNSIKVKSELCKDKKPAEIMCRLNVSMLEYKPALTRVGGVWCEPKTLYGSILYTNELVFAGSYLFLNRVKLQSFNFGSTNIFPHFGLSATNNRIKLERIEYPLSSGYCAEKDYKPEIEQSFRSQFEQTFDLIEEVNRLIREDAKMGVNLLC